MLSLPSGIYIFLGAILGSIISGTLLIINTSKNNNFQLERESQQRIWQEESERQKWYREKIYESYRTSIQILTKIIQAKFISEYDDSYNQEYDLDLQLFLKNLYFEFSSEFALIIAGYPDIDTKEINEIITKILDEGVEKDPFLARISMIRIMENDSRIKDVNKRYLNSEKSSTKSSLI